MTESAPAEPKANRKHKIYILIAAALSASLVALSAILIVQNSPGAERFGQVKIRYTRLTMPEELEKGLSGRDSLPPDEAMLFIFEQSGQHCFWMKEMKFPIDMVWLDENKRVIKILDNVQPESYPESFCPDKPARYVVEVNAGQARDARVEVGSDLRF